MIKFFHNLQTLQRTFLHMKAPQRKGNGDGSIPITFRIPLNGNNVKSAPKFVQEAYAEIQRGANVVGLKEKRVENLNVEIYNLPENKRPTLRLPQLTLKNIQVAIAKNSEGDSSTVLTFETLYPWDSAVWEYMGLRFATDVFLKFDAGQADLVEEEEETAGPALPLTEGQDEPAEE